jgi:hypothetical protein
MVGRMKCALLLTSLWSCQALAQPADCIARPNGPALPLEARIGLDGQGGVPKGTQGSIKLGPGAVSANGTTCGEEADPPDDVLHGAPAPHGLLRGEGPRDVLHDRPEGHVVVTPMPSAPPP